MFTGIDYWYMYKTVLTDSRVYSVYYGTDDTVKLINVDLTTHSPKFVGESIVILQKIESSTL